MKDSGNMEVYFVKMDAYEGVFASTRKISSINQFMIYAPNAGGVIAQSIQNKNEFLYITDERLVKDVERIIKEKDKGYLKSIDVDVDKFFDLVGIGNKKERINGEFNSKAKLLFDIVTEKASKGCCFDIVTEKASKGCCL